MKVMLLILIFATASCSTNYRKIDRLKQENPTCDVTDDAEIINCPLPWPPTEVYGNDEVIPKEEIDALVGAFDIKVKLSCKLREKPTMTSKVVGFVGRGKTVNVEKINKEWFSYYNIPSGKMGYLGIKCFGKTSSGVKSGKK